MLKAPTTEPPVIQARLVPRFRLTDKLMTSPGPVADAQGNERGKEGDTGEDAGQQRPDKTPTYGDRHGDADGPGVVGRLHVIGRRGHCFARTPGSEYPP